MGFFKKLSKWLGFDARSTQASPSAEAAKVVAPVWHSVAEEPKPDQQPPSPPETRRAFLDELRALPTQQTSLDQAKQDLVRELKRLAPNDKKGSK